ncbi:MAG: SMP-30/gluconolactonase/LRE family protein [Pseudomonadota bacterium]
MRLFMPMVFVVATGALAAAIGTLWLAYVFHQLEDVEVAGVLECTPVHGITGAYDVEAIPGTNAAFFSVYDERGDAGRGQIIRFDFDNPLDDTSWQDRSDGKPLLLRPGGISFFQDRLPSGILRQRLFVVNHEGPEVLVFDVDERGDLTLAERFSNELMTSPNDVVATGPSSFYVSNDTASGRQSVRGKADFLFGLPTGSVMYFDGRDWSVVADGLKFPNGMALAPQSNRLFVAEMRAEAVRRYQRDPATNQLEERGQIFLDSFPNNLSVDAEGRILVGSVPQPFAYKAFTESLRDDAPSQVIRIEGRETEVLYQDPGREFSAASVASIVGDKTIIGSAADRKFLMCPTI